MENTLTEQNWTLTQLRRFKELGINWQNIQTNFLTPEERNASFQQIEKKQSTLQRKKLARLLTETKKSQMQLLRERLEQDLLEQGFTSVITPTIITRQALEKMTIDAGHPLFKQVFWLNDKQCLRPMLAPNLYSIMQNFSRLNQKTSRFFEIGSCFRKESQGACHSNEFTMLNLVEMGVPEHDRQKRLEFYAARVMQAAGITDFHFASEESEVYGSTFDVLAGPEKIELASGAMGPHPLDSAWGITDSWVGMGFGLERLLMVAKADDSISKWTKNLSYIDGICLNI